MRNIINIFVLFFIFTLFSCKTTKYIEVPIIKTEYINTSTIDSIYHKDSIIYKEKGETIYIEKYKYLYKIKIQKDTINITDTITKVNTVEVVKYTNKLSRFQQFLLLLGLVCCVIIGYKVVNLIKNIF